MKAQKDRHLDVPSEANRDKHINFLAEENGDTDPADESFNNTKNENTEAVDNGFFTDDNNSLQTREENENDKNNHPSAKNEKVSPLNPDKQTTLSDKISIDKNSGDILTQVKDDNSLPYINEDDQAH